MGERSRLQQAVIRRFCSKLLYITLYRPGHKMTVQRRQNAHSESIVCKWYKCNSLHGVSCFFCFSFSDCTDSDCVKCSKAGVCEECISGMVAIKGVCTGKYYSNYMKVKGRKSTFYHNQKGATTLSQLVTLFELTKWLGVYIFL